MSGVSRSEVVACLLLAGSMVLQSCALPQGEAPKVDAGAAVDSEPAGRGMAMLRLTLDEKPLSVKYRRTSSFNVAALPQPIVNLPGQRDDLIAPFVIQALPEPVLFSDSEWQQDKRNYVHASTLGREFEFRNQSDMPLDIEVEGNVLFAVQQAMDVDGTWRDIEQMQESSCGNSSGRRRLPARHSWRVTAARYQGSMQTYLRVKMFAQKVKQVSAPQLEAERVALDRLERNPPSSHRFSDEWRHQLTMDQIAHDFDSNRLEEIYSAPYEGSVNPEQFTVSYDRYRRSLDPTYWSFELAEELEAEAASNGTAK